MHDSVSQRTLQLDRWREPTDADFNHQLGVAPTTVREFDAFFGPIRAAYLTADTRRTFHHPNGTRILAPERQQPGDYVRAAFSEIRMSSATQPTTLLALAESLSALRESLQVEGLEAEAVQRELRLVAQTVQEADFDESVAAPILRALDTPAQS